MKDHRGRLTMQAQETPATEQPSPLDVMEAADAEYKQPQEPWLSPHVLSFIASILTVASIEGLSSPMV